MQKKVLGFTLTELLVVVAVIGILGAVGYPSYQNYVREAKRTDGQGALLSMATEQERHYLSNNTYSGTTADVWTAVGGNFRSPEGHYTLLAVSGNASSFTVRATARAEQAADTDCAVFELDNTGRKVARNSGGTDTSAICW